MTAETVLGLHKDGCAPTNRDLTTWAGIVTIVTVIELILPFKFSHFTRKVFRTDKPAGKVAFVGAWAGLTAWFLPHILKEV